MIVKLGSIVGFIVSAVAFWAFGAAANDYPSTRENSDWIALLQPQLASDGDRFLVRMRSLTPGAPGPHPVIGVEVEACGSGHADVTVLLSSGLRPIGNPRIGQAPGPLPPGALLIPAFGNVVMVEGAWRTRWQGKVAVPCLQPAGDEWTGQVLASFLVQAAAPVTSTPKVLGLTAAHESQSWPMMGTIPGLPPGYLGVFGGEGSLAGSWVIPRQLSIELDIGKVVSNALVVTASPPLPRSDMARWKQHEPLHAQMVTLNQRTLARLQNLLGLAGILLGLFGGVVATLLLEISGGSGEPATAALPPSPPAPTSRAGNQGVWRATLGASLVAGLVAGLLVRAHRNRDDGDQAN